MTKALVTGIAGQDGSHMADLLVEKGIEVHGVVRRHSQPNHVNIQHLLEKDAVRLHEADLTDYASIEAVMRAVRPDLVFNFAAQSHVGTSFAQPELTMDVTGLGAMRVFEAVRQVQPTARVYQASSSEQYGNVLSKLARGGREEDRFEPVSPYGVAKLTAHHLAHMYRETHGLFIACGIMHNHEGERRGPLFVTRKITSSLARIKHGKLPRLVLGNLDAVRDWGYAPEYMKAAWRMLEHDEPDDWVVATGEGHTVRQFLEEAWRIARIGGDMDAYVSQSVTQKRPTDIDWLVGDAKKIQNVLGWRSGRTFEGVVRIMVEADMRREGGDANGR